MEEKSFKEYCREAKKRLKSGFWENYQKELNNKIKEAQDKGLSQNKVKEYFNEIAHQECKSIVQDDEDFYQKVKKILTEEGEVSNALGRLTDKDVYNSLSYEEKQRYTMSLSERYLKAVERFKKEKDITGS